MSFQVKSIGRRKSAYVLSATAHHCLLTGVWITPRVRLICVPIATCADRSSSGRSVLRALRLRARPTFPPASRTPLSTPVQPPSRSVVLAEPDAAPLRAHFYFPRSDSLTPRTRGSRPSLPRKSDTRGGWNYKAPTALDDHAQPDVAE